MLPPEITGDTRFFGFGAIDRVKFRGTVEPGDRLVLLVKLASRRSRRVVFESQGVVDRRVVFQATITGMVV